jgi:hypothetical protein
MEMAALGTAWNLHRMACEEYGRWVCAYGGMSSIEEVTGVHI